MKIKGQPSQQVRRRLTARLTCDVMTKGGKGGKGI